MIERDELRRTMIGSSAVIQSAVAFARRAAGSQAKVLITGESGVGKDLLAREIHAASPRAMRPFVALNCAGLSETLLESELFGHVRGSFTGAYRDKPGKLQLAHRGTLFLDEVGDMSPRMQGLLLRFLESGEIQPVGADTYGAVADVRVVAATNRNLSARVSAGQFREDLFYRLRVIHIRMPALRERPEDIPELVAHFARSSGGAQFTDRALALLMRYRWPGNVRELQNVVEQASWLAGGPTVHAEHLEPLLEERDAEETTEPREAAEDVAQRIYENLTTATYTFWGDVHPMFLARDLTRDHIRQVVHLGLSATRGNYRALLSLFGVPDDDYKRFLNFLSAHDCSLDVRPYRNGVPPSTVRRFEVVLPSKAAVDSGLVHVEE